MNADDLARTVLAREEARRAALLVRDTAALSDLLSDRLVFMHANATADTKPSLLARLAGGGIAYAELSVGEGQVLAAGKGVAILTGELSAKVSVQGTLKTIRNRVLMVWVDEGGSWRLLAYQPTPIAD